MTAPQSVWVAMCADDAPDGGDDFLVAVGATPDSAKRAAAVYVCEEALDWHQANSIFDPQDRWRAFWKDPDGSRLTFAVYEEEVVQ